MKLKLFLIAFVVLLLGSLPALAFSDDFNSYSGTYNAGGTFGGWNVVSGTATFQSPNPFDNSQYVLSSSGTINRSLPVGLNYSEVEMRNGTGETLAYYNFRGTSAAVSTGFSYDGVHLNHISSGGFAAFTWNQISIVPKDQWIKIITNITGGQITVQVYGQNGTLIDTQTSSYTEISNSNWMDFESSAGGASFDNVVATTSGGTGGVGAHNSITWNSDSYVKDDLGSYSWLITDADWTDTYLFIPYEFRAEIYQNDVLIKSVSLSSQTGTQFFTFSDIGSYKINLVKYYNAYYYLGLAGKILSTNAVVVRTLGDVYLSAPTIGIQGTIFNITYSFPVTVVTGYIIDSWGDGISFTDRKSYDLGCPCLAGTRNLTIYPNILGKHSLFLQGTTATKFLSASVPFVVYESIGSIIQINQTSLITDSINYTVGDDVQARYAVSNADIANYSAVDILVLTPFGVPLGEYRNVPLPAGLVTIPTENPLFGGAQVGQAYVNLSGRNYITGTVLISVPINITSISNSDGYNISAYPQKVGANQKIKVSYGTPSSGILQVVYLTPAMTTKTENYTVAASGSRLFTYNANQVSDKSLINFDLYNLSGYRQVGTSVVFDKSFVAPTPIPTPTETPPAPLTGDKAVSNLGDNLKRFMAMPAFWGLLLTIFMFLVIGKTVPNAMGFGMFLVLNIEAVIGLYDPYKFYILAVTWVFAGIYFSLGRKVLTGG